MKTLQIENFENLSNEELVSVNGGAGLSTLNPTISGLLGDLSISSVALFAVLNQTATDLTTNLDAALGSASGSGGLLSGLLGGGLLGGSGGGLLGGGLNL
jgi:hypothetical protein